MTNSFQPPADLSNLQSEDITCSEHQLCIFQSLPQSVPWSWVLLSTFRFTLCDTSPTQKAFVALALVWLMMHLLVRTFSSPKRWRMRE